MKLIFTLVFCLWSSLTFAADWYVSHTGGGLNDGSSCSNAFIEWTGIPWASIADGDVIHICDTLSGADNYDIQHSNVVITGDGVGKIDLEDTDKKLSTYHDTPGHSTGITIANLEVMHGTYTGIYLTADVNTDVTNNMIKNCTVHDLLGSDNTRMLIFAKGSGNTITGCTIYNGPGDMVYVDGGDFTFTHNKIYGTTNAGSAGRGDGIQCGGGSSGFTIQYNDIDISEFFEPKQCVIIEGNNSEISHNVLKSRNFGTETLHSNVIYLSGDNHSVFDNILSQGWFGIYLSNATNSKIYYNSISTLNRGGVNTRGSNLQIINNTIYDFVDNEDNESCYGIYIDGGATSIEVKNNIIIGSPDYGLWSNAVIDNDYNCLYGNSENTHNIAQGPNTINENPLISGYRIEADSPVRNAGFAILGIHEPWPNWAHDIDGDAVTSTPDIGADEFRIAPVIGASRIIIQ